MQFEEPLDACKARGQFAELAPAQVYGVSPVRLTVAKAGGLDTSFAIISLFAPYLLVQVP